MLLIYLMYMFDFAFYLKHTKHTYMQDIRLGESELNVGGGGGERDIYFEMN